MGRPSRQQGADDGQQSENRRVVMGELKDIGVEACLADDQRRGLGGHGLGIPEQEDLNTVAAGRHIGGKAHRRPEQLVAKKLDLPGLDAVVPDILHVANERGAKPRQFVAVGIIGRLLAIV